MSKLTSPAQTSVASEAVNETQQPDVPRGNSYVAYAAIDPTAFQPTYPMECPYERSLAMDQAHSESLAVALNRDRMQDVQFGKRKFVGSWHAIVSNSDHRTYVARVPVQEDWIPESEFDLPPLALSGLVTDKEARSIVKAVNTIELNRPDVRRWAIHIKSPGTSLVNRESFDHEPWDRLINILRGTGERVRTFNRDDGELLTMTSEIRFHSGHCKNSEAAGNLRTYAATLLKAAAQLDGAEEITLDRIPPCSHEFGIRGHDEDVCLRVYNTDNPEQARQQALKVLGLIKG